MNAVLRKAAPMALRIAVVAKDPERLSILTRLVRDFGHQPVFPTAEASVVLTDRVPVDEKVPVVALGVPGSHYPGNLPADASPEQIDAALRAVAAGLAVTPMEEGGGGFESLPDINERTLLTPRETEVLHAVSQGLTNKEIARQLGISQHTVKFHLETLMRKLGTSTRAGAVAASMRLKLLQPYRL